MSWDLERVKNEIKIFADYARTVLQDDECIDKLENCRVVISKRMTKTKGMFEFTIRRRGNQIVNIIPETIKIAQYLLDNYEDVDIIETIRHECVHCIANVRAKNDCGHNEIFKKYCRVLGISEETYFTASPKKDIPKKESRYICICQTCGKHIPRKAMGQKRIMDYVNYYRCAECEGTLHIKDLKDNVIYIKNESIPSGVEKIDLNSETQEVKCKVKPKVKTKEDYFKESEKLKAYAFIGACNLCDFRNEFDFIWWELLLVYDTCKEDLSKNEYHKLKKWLKESQKFTDEFAGEHINV